MEQRERSRVFFGRAAASDYVSVSSYIYPNPCFVSELQRRFFYIYTQRGCIYRYCNAVDGILICTDVVARGLDFPKVAMAIHMHGLHSYGLHSPLPTWFSYGVCTYDLYSFGIYRYGLHSHGMHSYGI